MSFIQQLWESYANEVVPKGAPPIQIQETRRAFYAGATALLQAQMALGDEGVTEEEGVRFFEDISEDIKEFLSLVEEGKA